MIMAASTGYGPLVPLVASGQIAAAANNLAKETLRKCLEATTLPPDIKRNVEGGISTRRL